MANAESARCPSCGVERPANATAAAGYAWLQSDRVIRRAATERAVAMALGQAAEGKAAIYALYAKSPGGFDVEVANLGKSIRLAVVRDALKS